jgi:serine/threonine protein phosphatase PrpC
MTTSTGQDRAFDLGMLRCAAGTDVGMRREENQDSFGVIKGGSFHAFFVADGMGGVHGGAVASRLTISSIEELLSDEGARDPDSLRAVIQQVNGRVFQQGSSDQSLAGMGTTIVGLIFTSSGVTLVNVGDSRAYRIRTEGVVQLSEDHTLVRELLKSGAISPEQAENHPVSHMLTRSLGPLEEVQIDCHVLSEFPEAGDVYVLCSDGLYNFVAESEILDVVRQNPLDDANQILINLANQRGGADNITVLVVSVGEPVGKGRSAAYRKARDTSTASSSSNTDAEKEQPPPASVESTTTTQAEELTNTDQQPNDPLSPVVQEPARRGKSSAIDRPRAARSMDDTKKNSSIPPKPVRSSSFYRSVPVPLMVAAALVLGLVVGSLAKRALSVLTGDEGRDAATSPDRTEYPSSGDNHGTARAREDDDRGLEGDNSGTLSPEVAVAAALVRAQSDRERMLKTREMFDNSIRRIDKQLAAFDTVGTPELSETLQTARVQADDLQGKLSDVELQIDAASRKLSQWFGRQRRLESTDPLKLAAEVGASSENVQGKKSAFEQATYEFIKKRDEFELYSSNEKLREQVNQLKDKRSQLLGQLGEEVRHTVERVLIETDKQLEELKYQRDILNIQLQSVKQDLDVAKSLSEPNGEQRQRMRTKLEQKRQGLAGSLAELDVLLAGAGTPEASEERVNEASVPPVALLPKTSSREATQ